MKFNLRALVIFAILLISMTFVSATPLNSLNNFYQASVDGDIDTYIAIQDPLFLAQQEINTTSYFQSFFNEVNTLNYEIINPEVFEKENSALIFYKLKGNAEIDGEKISIDNDMVAFLWKYDDWKVRWTITRTLYEEKIAFGFVMDTAIESTIDEAQNISLKQELIDEGFDVVTYDDELDNSSFSFSWTWIIISLLIIFIIFWRKRLKIILFKYKSKKILNNNFNNIKKYSKNNYLKISPQIKKKFDNAKKYSKNIYESSKPHIKKGINDIKKHSKSVYEYTKPLIKNLSEKIKYFTKNIYKKFNKKND